MLYIINLKKIQSDFTQTVLSPRRIIRKRDYHNLSDRRTNARHCDTYVMLRRPHITATNK